MMNMRLRLCAALLLLCSSGAWAGCALKSGSTVQATDAINLSDLLTSQDSYTETRAGSWVIPVTCFALLINSNNVHYISPLANGYWIKFSDAAGTDRWLKLKTSNYLSPENYTNGDWVLNGATYLYTLTVTLLTEDPRITDSNYYTIASGNSATVVTMAQHNAHLTDLTGKVPTVDEVAQVVAAGSWSNNYLGYQSLTITFNPAETTCQMPDQTITLPSVSLNMLRTGLSDGRTAFTLPVSCSNTLAGVASRSVNARLSSTDLIGGNQQIMRNASSGSSGVGVALTTATGDPVTLSTTASAVGATSLFSLARGAAIVDPAIELYAAYKIFDAAALSPGTVIATATLWFDYD
ncbi:fimbrial protein [Erwinia mallotivora]|uniref:fimbrial protein n=1 Tax=Erwinia mallotivora TaxID=69222 RepID=UPI0035EA9D02